MRTEILDPTSRFMACAAVAGTLVAAVTEFASAQEITPGGMVLGAIIAGTHGFLGTVMGGILARRPDDRWYSRIQRGWFVPLMVAVLVLIPLRWGFAIVGNSAGPFARTTCATAGCASLIVGLYFGLRWGAGAFCRGIAVGAGLGLIGYAIFDGWALAYIFSGLFVSGLISAWCLTEGGALFSQKGISAERWAFILRSIGLFTLLGLFPGPLLAPVLHAVCVVPVIHLIDGALIGATIFAIVDAARRIA